MSTDRAHCPYCTREVIRVLIGLDVRQSRMLWCCFPCLKYWDLNGETVEPIGNRLWSEAGR